MIFGNGNHLKSCVKHIFNPSQVMGTHLNFWLYFQSSFRLGTPARNRRWQHQHVVLARHLRGGEFFGSWQDDPVPKFDDFLKSFSINTGYILRYPILQSLLGAFIYVDLRTSQVIKQIKLERRSGPSSWRVGDQPERLWCVKKHVENHGSAIVLCQTWVVGWYRYQPALHANHCGVSLILVMFWCS